MLKLTRHNLFYPYFNLFLYGAGTAAQPKAIVPAIPAAPASPPESSEFPILPVIYEPSPRSVEAMPNTAPATFVLPPFTIIISRNL